MLDLRSAHRVTQQVHLRFQAEALPEALSEAAFARFDPSAYPSRTVEWARAAWEARLCDEYRSQVALTLLLADLTQEGFSFDVLGAAIRVVRDEARHVELCRRMVLALGGSEQIDGEVAHVIAEGDTGLERVLDLTIGFLCIGETLSARLIAAVRARATDPLAHAVLTEMLADESIHGQFGWTVLELITPVLSAPQRRAIRRRVPKLLRQMKAAVDDSAGDGASRNPFGALSGRERTRVFERCVEKDIRPRLQRLGY
ncbi:MAG: hypothetical protein H6Q89_4583 [Myxococcaceae bacterium]|nr:hypothetical protein [Myxococcaceae bacterium]